MTLLYEVQSAPCDNLAKAEPAHVTNIPLRPKNHLVFGNVPPVGLIVGARGQAYELVATEPYRNNGRDTVVLTWRSACIECGAPFDQTAPLGGTQYPNRKCKAHRKQNAQVASTSAEREASNFADIHNPRTSPFREAA